MPNPEDYYFSLSPVTHLKLVSTSVQDFQVNSIDDLKKHSVIVLTGFTYGGLLEGVGITNQNIVASVNDHSIGVDALVMGRGQFFLGYLRPTSDALKKYPSSNVYHHHFANIPVYIIVRKGLEDSRAIMHLINSHIEN